MKKIVPLHKCKENEINNFLLNLQQAYFVYFEHDLHILEC